MGRSAAGKRLDEETVQTTVTVSCPLSTHVRRRLGLRDASDEAIFQAAREADTVVLTKDTDFVRLLERRGPPPRVIWLTCGNTSNLALTRILASSWSTVSGMFTAGEALVEISKTLD